MQAPRGLARRDRGAWRKGLSVGCDAQDVHRPTLRRDSEARALRGIFADASTAFSARCAGDRPLVHFPRMDSGLPKQPSGMIGRLQSYRFLRFLVVGSLNTLFSYAVYAVMLFVGLPYVYANFVALATGVLFSFRTQGAFVFG